MKFAGTAALVAVALTLGARSSALATPAGDAALARYAAAWNAVQTYTVTMVAHEVKGTDVQDRTYQVYYSKPNIMRVDIVDGAGKGSQVLWQGGDTVDGHQGGFLRFFHLHLKLTNPLAVSMRGKTVADVPFGAVLDMIKKMNTSSLDATSQENTTVITAIAADPTTDDGVSRDVVFLSSNGLPIEYDQYEGDVDVNKIVYSDYKQNVPLPDSTWNI